MSVGAMYGGHALRHLRKQQEARVSGPECQSSLLDHLPPDAPMDDAILTVWNGKRFVAYDRWLATAPIRRDDEPANPNTPTPRSSTA